MGCGCPTPGVQTSDGEGDAPPLRLVHRGVGALQKLVEGPRPRRELCDSERDRDAGRTYRFVFDTLLEPRGQRLRVVAGRLGEHEHELVAAEACAEIEVAGCRADRVRDRADRGV